jgi:putative GTP pyrophosphokinase
LIADHIAGEPRVDRVTVRAKGVDRFLQKAAKEDGSALRYPEPIAQIQDQIGARIVVFYKSDVIRLRDKVLRYFTKIEEAVKVPAKDEEFGYLGLHFILSLPTDVIPEGIIVSDAPAFFELQIKTLFQHAWAEADHDLGYKPSEQLSRDQRRSLAFVAAQSWGADLIFDDLASQLIPGYGKGRPMDPAEADFPST